MPARGTHDTVGPFAALLRPEVPFQRPRSSAGRSGGQAGADAAGEAGDRVHDVVIHLRGDVDVEAAMGTAARIGAALAAGPASVDVNLESVTSIDVSLLHVLATWQERCDAAGSVLLVTCSSEPTRALFALAGMDGMLISSVTDPSAPAAMGHPTG